MDIHPIQESSRRWMTALILAVVAAGIQTTLLWGYAGADTLPAAIDGILSVGLLCLLAYLAWYVIGLVSILQTDLLIAALALLFWLAGGFAVQYVLEQNMGQVYAPFGETLPFRILFGALAWGVMMLCRHVVFVGTGFGQNATIIQHVRCDGVPARIVR